MRDIATTVILLGALQAGVLAPVLWLRRANRLANRIFATLVAAVGLMLLLGVVGLRWGMNGRPHLIGLGAPLPFLFGPLLYLYVIALTRPLVRVDPRWIVHALPFVADILFLGQVFYLEGGPEKVALAHAASSGTASLSYEVVAALQVVQALAYIYLSWRALERYGRKMHGYFSDLARIDLVWLRTFVLAHAVVWSLVLLTASLRWIGNPWSGLGTLVQLASALAIFLTGYVSLWQPELVERASAASVADPAPDLAWAPSQRPAPTPSPEPDPGDRPAPTKYQRNRLDDSEAQELATKLLELMEREHLYCESGLTLPTLADAVGATPHMLSQVLNVRIGKSFFVFVNAYRAEALKEALADPSRSKRGVLELAFEVGFSSKSTLNSFFKHHTGMTPTEFRGRARSPKRRVKSRS